MTVQGPVKKQHPDGMSHGGAGVLHLRPLGHDLQPVWWGCGGL